MDLFNSYLDRQITLNSLANQFAGGDMAGLSFVRGNSQNMLSGGGLGKGSGLDQNSTSGLSETDFKKRKPAVQQEMKVESKDEKEEVQDDGEIPMSGSVSSSASRSSDEGKHYSSPPASGFTKLIDGYGQDFPNSRSRKSVIFVPEERQLPLKGWKSLRKAGISTKHLGKINKNGDSFAHTEKDGSKGNMYFLNNNAWKSLQKRKDIQLQD